MGRLKPSERLALSVGLSDVAVQLLWVVAIVGVGAAATTALENAASDVVESTSMRHEEQLERAAMRLTSVSYCYDGTTQTLILNATNAGDARLNASLITFVADGVPYSFSTAEIVGVGSTSRWLPGETAYLNRTSFASDPSHLVLVTERGVAAYATHLSCPSTVHVSALATYLSGVETSTFQKRQIVETRVTVVDTNGAAVNGASVTIELVKPDASVAYTGSATTDASGIASISYELPASSPQGTWTDRVTSVSGSGLTYDSAANLVTQVTFTVIP